MPILRVFGLPSEALGLIEFHDNLQKAVAKVSELELTQMDVSVFFVPDMAIGKPSTELIVFVDGLFDRPERTPEVRQCMAESLCETCMRYVQQHVQEMINVRIIEVIVQPPFDKTRNGFARRQFA